MSEHDPTTENEAPKPVIALQLVKSSMLHAHGYDTATKTLAVQFKADGPVYHYGDVPAEVAEGLAKAESAGRFFGSSIRSKFKAVKQ